MDCLHQSPGPPLLGCDSKSLKVLRLWAMWFVRRTRRLRAFRAFDAPRIAPASQLGFASRDTGIRDTGQNAQQHPTRRQSFPHLPERRFCGSLRRFIQRQRLRRRHISRRSVKDSRANTQRRNKTRRHRAPRMRRHMARTTCSRLRPKGQARHLCIVRSARHQGSAAAGHPVVPRQIETV